MTRSAGEDAHLFKPATVVPRCRSDDNGTPLQKDEPHADNPVEGAVIYYWLKSRRRRPGHARDRRCAGCGGRDDPGEAEAECGARRSGATASSGSRRSGKSRRPVRCRPRRGCIASCGRPSSREAPTTAATPEEQQPRVHTGVFTVRLAIGGKRLDAGARGPPGEADR